MFLQFIKNLLSRKLLFSFFSVICILFSVSQAARVGLDNSVLLIALPCTIICITVICVTFVTGLAKIDLAASATYGKKE